MELSRSSSPRAEFFAGMRAIIPLVIGAIPFGLIYGASARSVGLSPAATIGMSLFVFAGSSQFIAVSLIRDGAMGLLIVLTTFIVNARHALYSASLGPHLSYLPQRWLLPLAFFLTDESFAITAGRFDSEAGKSPHRHWFMLGTELAMYVNWQICTLTGFLVGGLLQDANLGFDFAMSVTFIGIVVPLIGTRPMLVSAVVAGTVALLFDGLPNKLGLLIAALAAIIAGYVTESVQNAAQSAGKAEAHP